MQLQLRFLPEQRYDEIKQTSEEIALPTFFFFGRVLAGMAILAYNRIIVLVKKSKTVGDTMSNIADLIEKYILYRMANEEDPTRVVLKRNEIAEEIACAPSQITYVLGTRFTNARGFQVESRRGSGGFISITRATEERLLPQVIRRIDEETTREELASYVQSLAQRGEITMREGTMVMAVARYAFEHAEPTARAQLLREMLYPLMSSNR